MGRQARRAVSAEDRVQKAITAPALEDGGKKVPAKYPGKGLLEDEPRPAIPKVEDASKKAKRVSLSPSTDPEDLTTAELLEGHDRLHFMYRAKAHAPKSVKGWSVEDIVNVHALIVGELQDRKKEHPPPPDDGLDDVSEDFERAVEKRYAVVRSSGVEEGEEIKLDDVISHFKSFKIRKPYVYLVGGLANHGKTKGDIDILVKDSDKLPEAFKHALQFRLGRALPAELAERLSIHYDKFYGPFTKHVVLYDLTLEAIPERKVIEMRASPEDESPTETDPDVGLDVDWD